MQEKFIYDGKYSVTDSGKVYSFVSGTKKQMSPAGTSANGRYQSVCLQIHGKQTNKYVHRLVAEAFIPNPNKYPQVNHIDGNPENNDVSNLEWCTNGQNSAHAYRIGLHKTTECPLCGAKRFYRNYTLCQTCRRKIMAEVEKEATLINRANGAMSALNNMEGVSDKRARYLMLRAKGLTYNEIAEIEGCSKQYIHQEISKYICAVSSKQKGDAPHA